MVPNRKKVKTFRWNSVIGSREARKQRIYTLMVTGSSVSVEMESERGNEEGIYAKGEIFFFFFLGWCYRLD